MVPRDGHSKASLSILDLRLLSWLPLLLTHSVQRAERILHGKAPQSAEINTPMEMSVHSQPRMCVSWERSQHQRTSQHTYRGVNKQKTLSRSRGLGVQPLEREADNCVVTCLVNVERC